MRPMAEVRLSGFLVCEDEGQLRIVREHLPDHLALTRAEPGCLSFEVAQTEDPLVWRVHEVFRDDDAFRSHQRRTAASDWGRATAGILRRYTVRRAADRSRDPGGAVAR